VQLALVAVPLAFAVGSIPFGVLVARARGVDERQAGSGNIGATNVARTAGKAAGLITLALDAAKGAAPVAIADALGADAGTRALVGLAAILGHVLSPFLGFRGGKGVATAAGAFAVLTPAPLAVALAAFALTFAARRIVSLASLVAVVVLTAATAALDGRPAMVGLAALVAAVVFVRHRGNIVRLRRGTEPRL
jgi:glycerol-3-phosphate acyltransferase PlsY